MMEKSGAGTVRRLRNLTVGDWDDELTPEEGAEYDALQVDIAQRLDTLAAARKAAEPLRRMTEELAEEEDSFVLFDGFDAPITLGDMRAILVALDGEAGA